MPAGEFPLVADIDSGPAGNIPVASPHKTVKPALIVVSHDQTFLQAIGIEREITLDTKSRKQPHAK